MLNTVYFITTDYIKKYLSGYLDPNIDASNLDSFILLAQNVRVQSVLGYDLYTKYINDINTYQAPQGTQYVYLMDNYIQMSTALWSVYEALPSLGFKVTNKAVSQKDSQYGHASNRNDIEYIRQQLSNNAQFYDSRIREYITNYPNLFPEYYITTGVNRIRAKQNNYFGGLWLPDVIRRNGGKQGGWQQDERCAGCPGGGNGYYFNL
jgi:hypothetical protein